MNKKRDISTLDEIIDALKNNTDNAESILDRVNLNVCAYHSLSDWDNDQYVRKSIYKCDDFELALLFWNPDIVSAIHDHNGESGYIYVIDGSLKEDVYELKNDSLIKTKTHVLNKGKWSRISGDKGIHQVSSLDQKTISLHIYVQSFNSIYVYDDKANKELQYV